MLDTNKSLVQANEHMDSPVTPIYRVCPCLNGQFSKLIAHSVTFNREGEEWLSLLPRWESGSKPSLKDTLLFLTIESQTNNRGKRSPIASILIFLRHTSLSFLKISDVIGSLHLAEEGVIFWSPLKHIPAVACCISPDLPDFNLSEHAIPMSGNSLLSHVTACLHGGSLQRGLTCVRMLGRPVITKSPVMLSTYLIHLHG